MYQLAQRTKGAFARDGTTYGASALAAKTFYVHWSRRLSGAAVRGNARHVREQVRVYKRNVLVRSAAVGSGSTTTTAMRATATFAPAGARA